MWVTNTQEPDTRVISDASGLKLGMWGSLPAPMVCLPVDTRADDQVHPSEGTLPSGRSGSAIWETVERKSSAIHGRRQNVVDILKEGYSRESHLVHVIKMLVSFFMPFPVWWTAEHILGADNTLADAISRNNLKLFLPQASPMPSEQAVVPS